MLNQPVNKPISAKEYELIENYYYVWDKHDVQYALMVPKGFVCDGASVPRFCWSLLGIHPDGLNRAAALVHDYLYLMSGETKTFLDGQSAIMNWKRRDADRLFCRILRESGVSKFKRRMMYRAVRIFGRFYWGKSRN